MYDLTDKKKTDRTGPTPKQQDIGKFPVLFS